MTKSWRNFGRGMRVLPPSNDVVAVTPPVVGSMKVACQEQRGESHRKISHDRFPEVFLLYLPAVGEVDRYGGVGRRVPDEGGLRAERP